MSKRRLTKSYLYLITTSAVLGLFIILFLTLGPYGGDPFGDSYHVMGYDDAHFPEEHNPQGHSPPEHNSPGDHPPGPPPPGPPPPGPPPPSPSLSGHNPTDSQGNNEQAKGQQQDQEEAQNPKPQISGGLTADDFPVIPSLNAYDLENDIDEYLASRYASLETWRTPDTLTETYLSGNTDEYTGPERPVLPPISQYTSKGSYLKQPLVADYAVGSDKIFLMMKDGSNILWDRVPIHLATTFTRVPNYAIYADVASSIAGHEVIDVLKNVSTGTLESKDFDMYRKLKNLHMHSQWDSADLKDMNDGWNLDKFKNLPMLKHAYDVARDSEWFVFMDADTYIMMDTLAEQLKKLNYKDKVYGGSLAALDMGFAHGGSGVIISKGAMDAVFDRDNIDDLLYVYEKEAAKTCCGDYMVAKMFKEVADISPIWIDGVQGNPIAEVGFDAPHFCRPIMTFHHINSHDINILWEYERLRGPNKNKITYADIYRDFVQPYAVPLLEDWDNGAKEHHFSETEYSTNVFNLSKPEDLKPHESVENCQKACDLLPDCVMFKYVVDRKTCFIDRTMKLGRLNTPWISPKSNPSNDYHFGEKTFSGWHKDHFREVRKNVLCDVLYHSEDADGEADGSDSDKQEGWYYRRQDYHRREKEEASQSKENDKPAENKEKEEAEKNKEKEEAEKKEIEKEKYEAGN